MSTPSTQRPLSIEKYYDPRGHVDLLIRAALDAAEPGAALERHWPQELKGRSCRVLAVGKAAGTMFAALVRRELCDVVGAIAICLPGVQKSLSDPPIPVTAYDADHPLPTERNIEASRQVVAFVREAQQRAAGGSECPLVVLLSGGASALMTLPRDGVTLEDCRAVTGALLRAGAPIEELNCVRKHLEVLKGGGLARLAAPMPVWTMILSDVIGDDLSSIGSGPTCADPTTFGEALAILKRYDSLGASAAVTRLLEEGAAGRGEETVKPRDPILANVHHRIIGNNEMALQAVARQATALGFKFMQTTAGVRGEARTVGRQLANQVLQIQPGVTKRSCILVGGETTVTVSGGGKGGRNQEIALAAAIEIADKGDIVIASFSTDGVDGPTDAAGAVSTSASVANAAARGVDARKALAENDSYCFFEAARGLIRTGPTGTNVNDITVALVYPPDGIGVGARVAREPRAMGAAAGTR